MSQGHNIETENQAPEYVKARNKKLLDAYNSIILTVDKIQGFLNDEFLRKRIESNMMLKPGIKATIYQCSTPWCFISIGCDTKGKYNIVYSIDHRIQKMLGENMASGIIRRIYDFTPGEMEGFVEIGCLFEDCVTIFNQLFEEHKTESFHKLIVKATD